MSWCNCSVENDGSIDFYHDEIRTARKDYKCGECDTPIKKGDKYEYVSGKWEGVIDCFRTCLMCVDIRDHFCPDGFTHGGLDWHLDSGINKTLADIRSWWIMPGPERTIQGLVDLVCELLEGEPVEEIELPTGFGGPAIGDELVMPESVKAFGERFERLAHRD